MEIGGFFLLVLIVIILGVVGGAVYAIAARLRQKQLGPAGDEVEGPRDAGSQQRPEHVEVESEQQSDFVGTR
jgi:hypothetical protein